MLSVFASQPFPNTCSASLRASALQSSAAWDSIDYLLESREIPYETSVLGGDDEIGACELEVSVDQYAKQISHLIWIKVNKKKYVGAYSHPREHQTFHIPLQLPAGFRGRG